MSKITNMADSLSADIQNKTTQTGITPVKANQELLPVTHENKITDAVIKNRNSPNPTPIKLSLPGQNNPDSIKFNFSPEALDWLKNKGYDPNNIDRLYEYNPAKHGPATEIFNRIFQTPKVPDEKKIKQAKTAATIGDALSALAQMWSAGKGAHVQKRSYEESASSRLNNNIKEINNLYNQKTDTYNNRKYNLAMKDYSSWMTERDELIKQIEKYENMITGRKQYEQAQYNREASRKPQIQEKYPSYKPQEQAANHGQTPLRQTTPRTQPSNPDSGKKRWNSMRY